ncbi:hypothetical protein D9M68_497170 [compost metagenome]
MAQVVAHRGQRRTLRKGVGRMGVPHPVGRGAAQLVPQGGVFGLDRFGRQLEETAQHVPQPRRGDPFRSFQIGDERCVRLPVRRRHRQAALRQVLVERVAGERGQRDLAWLGALAHQVQPAFAARADLDAAECHSHQFAGAQPRGIPEIEQEAQALRGRRCPAVRPLEPIGDAAGQLPLTGRECPGGVQVSVPLTTSHLEPGKRIGQHIALLDQPSEHRTEYRQCISDRACR